MKNTLLLFLFLTTTACITTAPKFSPQQRRALQVKSFEASYNHVFRAFKTVLQDEGYIIKNQDMQGGLIVAHASKSIGSGSMFLAQMSGEQNYHTGTTYEVSVNLEKIRENYVETRVIIQKTDAYSLGASRGEEVFKPALYRNIYSKVRLEVARRKAQKK